MTQQIVKTKDGGKLIIKGDFDDIHFPMLYKCNLPVFVEDESSNEEVWFLKKS